MTAEQLNCPKCGQVDMVQKVSAIYSGGITTSSLSGSSVGGAVPIGKGQISVGGGYTTLKGGSQSLLSQRLTQPQMPSAEGMSGNAIGCGTILFCSGIIILGVIFFVGGIMSWIILPLVLIFAGSAILIVSYNAAKERIAKANSQMPQWEKAMAIWNALYFCARDDGVFDPNERVFIPIHQLMDYLYR